MNLTDFSLDFSQEQILEKTKILVNEAHVFFTHTATSHWSTVNVRLTQ